MTYYTVIIQRGCERFDPVDIYHFISLENAIHYIETLIANTKDKELKQQNATVISEYRKGRFDRYTHLNSIWSPIQLRQDNISFEDE